MTSTYRSGTSGSMLCLLIALMTVLQACSDVKPIDLLNAVIPKVGYTLSGDIVYGDESRQVMDIYHPSKPADNHQLIVFVYGGAWRTGSRSEYEFVGQALSSAGHTVVIPDYRLYPEVSFPHFITDVAAAVASLPQQSSLAQIDTESVVLLGHSSGAHSVAMLTTDSRFLKDANVDVSALIGLAGPYDLPLDNPEVKPVFSDYPVESVTPVLRVKASHPRSLLLHGLSDKRVDPRHTRRFKQALESKRVPVTMHLLKGASHAGILAGVALPLRFTNDTLEHVLDFLSALDT